MPIREITYNNPHEITELDKLCSMIYKTEELKKEIEDKIYTIYYDNNLDKEFKIILKTLNSELERLEGYAIY